MKQAVLITVLMLILAGGALLTQLSTSDEEYSRYNIGWNGTSEFFLLAAGKEAVYSYADLAGRNNTTLLVLVPPGDIPGLEGYLAAGNTVIIVDQSGAANAFLERVNSSMRVFDEPLLSTSQEYRDPGLFRGTAAGEIYGVNVTGMIFNYPGHIEGGEPVVTTSYLSWVDTTRNNIPDANESLKVYTLIAKENVSGGKVVVIADPSLFINSMLVRKHTGNLQALDALLAQDLLIDQTVSGAASGGGLAILLQEIRKTPVLGSALLAVLLLITAILAIRRFDHDRK
jgi:hypothetical protein